MEKRHFILSLLTPLLYLPFLGMFHPAQGSTVFLANSEVWDRATGKIALEKLVESDEARLLVWKKKEVSFWVNTAIPEDEPQIYSPEEIYTAARTAINAWNQAGAAIQLKLAGTTEKLAGVRDGFNVLSFVPTNTLPESMGSHPLGMAEVLGELDSDLSREQVVLNECDVLFSAATIAPAKDEGLIFTHTVLHEIGHCLGLGHSSIPEAHMNYSEEKFGEEPPHNALSDDERIALLNLYPNPDLFPKTVTIRGNVLQKDISKYGVSVTAIDAKTGRHVTSVVSGMTFDQEGRWTGYANTSGAFELRFLPPGEYFFLFSPQEESGWTARLKSASNSEELFNRSRERLSVQGPWILKAGSTLNLPPTEIPKKMNFQNLIGDFFIRELGKWVPSQSKRLMAGKENHERYRIQLTKPSFGYGELLWDPNQNGAWGIKFLSRSIEIRHVLPVIYHLGNGHKVKYLEADLTFRKETAPGRLLVVLTEPNGIKHVLDAGIFMVTQKYQGELDIFKKLDPRNYKD